MTSRSAYLCQIQACNVILIILGLVAVGLAGSQFSDVSLGNYRRIDLRLLNWIYVLAGLVGLYTLARNHGIVVAKTLYCISIVIAIYSTAFYCITLYRIVHIYDTLEYGHPSPQFEMQYRGIRENYAAKLVICSLMIAVPAIACLAALIAATLLDRLIVVTQPTWPQYSRDQDKKYRASRLRLTTSAAVKLFLALCALALAIFLEYEHQLILGTDAFVVIGLDHITALLAITSAIVDLHSAVINRQPAANYKVAIGVAVVAAVWCLKSLDIGMYPYYYDDIQMWRGTSYIAPNGTQIPPPDITTDPGYAIIIVEGILVGLFALLFGLNLLTAVQAGKCIQYEYYNESTVVEKSIAMQSRCLGLLHMIWGILLMALVVLGLIDVRWNANFLGADLMWLAVLLFVTGLLYVGHSSSHLTAQFVLGFVCFTCSLEKMCSSINLVYQSATYPPFINSAEDMFIGRLVLHCVQLAVLFFETLTALYSVILCGRALRRRYRYATKHSACIHMILFLGNMFYGVVLVGCHVMFAVAFWRFSESPTEIPFFRISNGVLVFGISILQVLAICYPALLLSVTILNVVAASVALFMVSYAMSNTYYLAALLGTVTGVRWIIIEVALILAAAAALACIICTFCATFAALSSLYSMHRKPTSTASTIVPYEENNYGTLRTLVTPQLQTPPVRHMEEQSIYWSADENPYYYQASKRFYDQPYKIDSGFYGYALVGPQTFESPYGIMSAGGVGSGPYFRNVNSVAAQTRIGHVFS